MFFPEGTRSFAGHFVKFNPGVGWLAIKCGTPVVPVCIKGTNTPLLRQLIRKERVYVKFGPPITKEYIGKLKPDKRGREQLVQEIKHRIEKLL